MVLTMDCIGHQAASGERKEGYWGSGGRAKQEGGGHSRPPRSCPPAPAVPSVGPPPGPAALTAAAGSACGGGWPLSVCARPRPVSTPAPSCPPTVLTGAVSPARGGRGWPPPGGAAAPPAARDRPPPAGTAACFPAAAAGASPCGPEGVEQSWRPVTPLARCRVLGKGQSPREEPRQTVG